jgi:NADH:ubiquinone oxidoreductase subunit 4 (subunit M)
VELHDVNRIEWIAWTPILIAIVALGIYPKLLFDITDPAVSDLVARLGEHLQP